MQKTLKELKQLVVLAESQKDKLVLSPLPYKKTELAPVMSKETLDYHYRLAKSYVDRYNSNEGDLDFTQAGAFLHNLFFPQLKPPVNNNQPVGASNEFINKYFDKFDKFKDEFEKIAMSIQGSGWVYLARNGQIKTIKNHAIRQDIIVLIDWWEHAYNLQYLEDKRSYLKNTWRIIDWSVINSRLDLKS